MVMYRLTVRQMMRDYYLKYRFSETLIVCITSNMWLFYVYRSTNSVKVCIIFLHAQSYVFLLSARLQVYLLQVSQWHLILNLKLRDRQALKQTAPLLHSPSMMKYVWLGDLSLFLASKRAFPVAVVIVAPNLLNYDIWTRHHWLFESANHISSCGHSQTTAIPEALLLDSILRDYHRDLIVGLKPTP